MEIKKNPYFFGTLAIAAWATVATAFKISFNYFSVVQVLCYSIIFSFISILISSIILGKTKEILSQSKKHWLYSSFLALLNPIMYYFVLFSAYNSLPAQEAMIINYTWPIFFGISSAIVGKIKISKYHILAFLLSFFGMVIIASKGNITALSFGNIYGDLLALLSAIIWTIFWLLNIQDKRDPVVKLFSIFLFGALYSFLILLFTENIDKININGIVATAYIGFFEMGFTFILWLTAISTSKTPHKISQLIYITPFLSLVVISLILKENIHLSSIIGLFLIILGIVVQQKSK